MKRMRLRYAGTCAGCAAPLDAGTTAWWDATARQVTCVACQAAMPAVAMPAVDVVPAGATRVPPSDPLDRGVAGASARREGERRSARRDERVRTRHPRLGGLMLALSDDPTSTKAWAKGAIGEAKVGAALEAAAHQGIEVLHDRRMPRSRANIDHLVVAPSGIGVVDAKRYQGQLERRDVGGWRRTDLRLYVDGRDQTKLVDGAAKQVAAVEAALARGPWDGVPVHGALCFVDSRVGWFAKPFRIRGVLVSWPRELVAAMVATTALDVTVRAGLLHHLARVFPRA
ncbi:MAG TPA: nuclease-related domain-containing protein [Iamia sp.]|nr:nuclease-related domain-containing protein [Iamia sp.]